jgi:hypothetical protein
MGRWGGGVWLDKVLLEVEVRMDVGWISRDLAPVGGRGSGCSLPASRLFEGSGTSYWGRSVARLGGFGVGFCFPSRGRRGVAFVLESCSLDKIPTLFNLCLSGLALDVLYLDSYFLCEEA